MSSEAIARIYQKRIDLIVKEAEEWGVSVSVTRKPLLPLAMGHARHVVETWPARRQPAPPKQS